MNPIDAEVDANRRQRDGKPPEGVPERRVPMRDRMRYTRTAHLHDAVQRNAVKHGLHAFLCDWNSIPDVERRCMEDAINEAFPIAVSFTVALHPDDDLTERVGNCAGPAAASVTVAPRVSTEDIGAWAERHGIIGNPQELRTIIDDARSLHLIAPSATVPSRSFKEIVRDAKEEAAIILDAARMDWLENPSCCYRVHVQSQPSGFTVFADQGYGLRAAIDAAMDDMAKTQQGKP